MTNILEHPAVKRFLHYITFDTASVERDPKDENPAHPSSPGQIVLVDHIRDELLEMGAQTDWMLRLPDSSLLVQIPASPGMENAPHLALAFHVDTYPGVPGKVDNPIIHHYEGGDIELPNNDIVIPASDLVGLEGTDILTNDGTGLVGGDDKGGGAVTMTALEDALAGKIKHGPLTLWVCVDEEIGELGFEHLDPDVVKSWNMFMTVDGGRLGPIDVACFYCRIFQMTFKGSDAHPGEAPDKLQPSHYAAMRFAMEMLDFEYDMPEAGIDDPLSSFFYVTNIKGDATETIVNMAPRSFNLDESEEMVTVALKKARRAATEFGCTVEITRNKLATVNNFDCIDPRRHLLVPLLEAHAEFGIETSENMVRGGTDGSMLNVKYPDIATPNMGYGSEGIHGRYENVCLQQLISSVEVLKNAIVRFGELELPTE